MKILMAKETGMCSGVRRALNIINKISHPKRVAIYGELVHNEEILRKISSRGFSIIPAGRLDQSGLFENIVISAHGISDYEKAAIIAAKKKIIDTTCPLVKHLHDKAVKFKREGYFIVLIGKKDHVEVIGIIKDLLSFCIVEEPEDVIIYEKEKIAVLSQTTMIYEKAFLIYEKVKNLNPKSEVIFSNTLCPSTKNRQDSLRSLINKIDILMVIGGKNSNNTRQLCKIAAEAGIEYKHIQCPEDINPRWFFSKSAVGITAGASTPDEAVIGVYEKIKEIKNYFTLLKKTLEIQLIDDFLTGKK